MPLPSVVSVLSPENAIQTPARGVLVPDCVTLPEMTGSAPAPKTAVIVRTCVMGTVIWLVNRLLTMLQPLVCPDQPVKCAVLLGVAVSTTLSPGVNQPPVVTEPAPLTAVVRRYCICQFHVSVALLVR